MTVSDTVEMMETDPTISLATYAFVPSGVMAMPRGEDPTVTVAVTVLDVVEMTETLLFPAVTYTFAPSGVIARRLGVLLIGIVAITVLVAVAITDTLLPS